jgi:hypothetical protein
MEQYQCADCLNSDQSDESDKSPENPESDHVYHSLLDLLQHKVDQCLDAKICRICHTNLSEYGLLKYMIKHLQTLISPSYPKVKVICSLCEKHKQEIHDFPHEKDFQIGGSEDHIYSSQIGEYAKQKGIPKKVVVNYLDGLGRKTNHLPNEECKDTRRGWIGIKFTS